MSRELKYEVWDLSVENSEQVLAEFPSMEEARQFVSSQTGDQRYSIRSVQTISTLPWANAGSFLFVLLQSACTAVMAISGFRLLIGLSALAAASGIYAPARGFHQDAIRIPMMILALLGALANLYSVWRVRSLRARPASSWRVRPVSSDKLRSERVQIGLAVLTLLLLAGEWVTHPMIHRV